MTPSALPAPRVGIYARQSVREDQGIAHQLAALRKRATGEDWNVVDEYVDNFTSATKTRGEGTAWARMLADVDTGRIDTVVAVRSARLLRRVEDALEVTAPRRVVRVITFDGIDTANHFGKLILLMMTSIAEAEIEEKESRAIPYRAARRDAGHPTPGLVPYGYRWVPDMHRDENGTRYAVVPEEAEVLRFMSRRLLAGDKLGTIVRMLDDGEATDETGTPLGQSSRHPRPRVDRETGELTYSRWLTTTARRLLVSPFQAALLPPAMPEGVAYRADRFTLSQCTPGAWEPILTADAVNAARGILLDVSRQSHDGDTRSRWMLTGIGRCGRCHGPIRSAQTKTASPVRGYRCTAGCFQRPADGIEAYVSAAVIDVLSAPGLLAWVDEGEHDIDALRTRRGALAAIRAGWLAQARAGTLTPTEWESMSADWDAELSQIDADLADATRADPLAEFVSVEDVRGLWEGLTVERQRAVLGSLVHYIELHPVGKGKRVRTPEEVEPTVYMAWRRARHTVSLATGATTHTGMVPDDAKDAVSAALSTS